MELDNKIGDLFEFVYDNRDWLFSGIGVVVLMAFVAVVRRQGYGRRIADLARRIHSKSRELSHSSSKDAILGQWHFEWLVEKPDNYPQPVVTETVSFLKLEGNLVRGVATGSPVNDYDIVGYVAPLNLSFSYKPKTGPYEDWTGAVLLVRNKPEATEMKGWYTQYRQGKSIIHGSVKAVKHPVLPRRSP